MTAPAAVVFGCAGPALSDDEASLFRDCNPLGFILFARNIEAPDQVRELCDALRRAVLRDDAPILIDQEGGRVQRLGPPHWPGRPPMRRFGEKWTSGPNNAVDCAALNARLIAEDLHALGIDVDCAPVLDLPAADGHEIIGDRAFAADPEAISELGRAVCTGLLAGGVIPVIKHLPGHGRATADSHAELPHVGTAIEVLAETDFVPFASLKDAPAGMTAHIVYDDIDPDRPCSASTAVIDGVIRVRIGFDGLLFSDDVCMKALSGSWGERVLSVLGAGCDVALHCDGNPDSMREIAADCPAMTDEAVGRMARARAAAIRMPDFDRDDAERRVTEFLKS